MNDDNQSANSAEGKPKKLNLDALLPAKAMIATSIGAVYVRHFSSSDWKSLELDDAVKLGRISIQRLCNRIEDKRDTSPLPDKDLNLLNDADWQVLVQAVAKQNGWRELPGGSGLKELGDVIKDEKLAISDRHDKVLRDLRESLDSSYSFLGEGALEKLQKQMAGIADIRMSLAGTESIQAALRAATPPELSGIYEAPKVIMPPRLEETPMGRATLESAENSRQVAERMDALVVVVAGLNQTLVQDVLPAWADKIADDQKAAKDAFDQAARGLWWTKWAVITSVLVTIAATWWQIDVAKSLDRENSEQQKRAETILREQLEAQHNLIEQQAKDAEAMREAVATLKQPAPIGEPKPRSGR